MKILNRELQATDGNVVFTKGLRVGYLPQETFFKEDLTVEEVIEQTLLAEVSDHTTLSPSARDEILSRLFLDTKLKEKANLLSGGWQKKLAIALELIKAPDVLLLDEPTNHLDIDSIQWLEEYLARTSFAYVVISHDRSFLNKTADKVI
jgi:ATP-binding cassette subfamily F protein uup